MFALLPSRGWYQFLPCLMKGPQRSTAWPPLRPGKEHLSLLPLGPLTVRTVAVDKRILCCSVVQSCSTHYDPMDCNRPSFPGISKSSVRAVSRTGWIEADTRVGSDPALFIHLLYLIFSSQPGWMCQSCLPPPSLCVSHPTHCRSPASIHLQYLFTLPFPFSSYFSSPCSWSSKLSLDYASNQVKYVCVCLFVYRLSGF